MVSQEIIRKPSILLAVCQSQDTEAGRNQNTDNAHMLRITEKSLGEIVLCVEIHSQIEYVLYACFNHKKD